jgi:hypothetical protein
MSAKMQGFFELKTSKDLLRKIEHEYDDLETHPTESYAAFNFMVTAYHIVDWLYPNDSSKRKTLIDNTLLLQVASHLANGAKHFRFDPNRRPVIYGSVSDARHKRYWRYPFGVGVFGKHEDRDATR